MCRLHDPRGPIDWTAEEVFIPALDDAKMQTRAHPELDAGVHLTLTSEWEGYRWPPLSTRDPASGLCDELGILVWEEIPWCRGGLGGPPVANAE